MNCPENDTLIHAYLDGELDLLSTLQLEAHLRECTACAQAYKNHQTLRSAMSNGGLYFKPPRDLAESIHGFLKEPFDIQRRNDIGFYGHASTARGRNPGDDLLSFARIA